MKKFYPRSLLQPVEPFYPVNARIYLKLSQEEMAFAIGMKSPRTWQKLEYKGISQDRQLYYALCWMINQWSFARNAKGAIFPATDSVLRRKADFVLKTPPLTIDPKDKSSFRPTGSRVDLLIKGERDKRRLKVGRPIDPNSALSRGRRRRKLNEEIKALKKIIKQIEGDLI